ncbi:MAG: glycosyltransferase, partial [Nitrososphaera sp.]|nr:glycosyltransferase [Nitrososphaera sp.]
MAYSLTRTQGIELTYVGSEEASYGSQDALDRAGVSKLLVSSGHSTTANTLRSLNPSSYSKITEHVRRFQPGVVHFATTHAWHFLLVPLLRRYASVSTIHDPIRHLGAESRFYAALTGVEAALADRVIVLSQAHQSSLARFGKPVTRVNVIPHGELGCGGSFRELAKKNQILFVGRIEPYKGLNILVEAFKSVSKRHPQYDLVIAGKGDLTCMLGKVPIPNNI